MDTISHYREIIQQVLLAYAAVPYAQGSIECKPVFDLERDRFVLLTEGWHGARRIHGCLVHIDVIDEKIWIQRDDTDSGVTYDLINAGIPRQQIVLGFQEPAVRQYTDFAVT